MFDRITRTLRPLITTCVQTMNRPCAAIGRARALSILATASLALAAQAPVAAITAASPVTANATGLAASVPVQSGATYTWTISGGTITSSGTDANLVYTAGAAGTLTLNCTVTAADSTTATGTKSVSVIAAPVATITAAAAVTTGTAGLKATVPTQSGATYAWTVTGGTVTAGATTASVTYTAGGVGSASLSCTVTNAAGTSVTGTKSVSVVAPPTTPVLTAATPVTTGVAGQTAAASSQPGVTYTWTVTGGTITAGQGTTNLTYTPGAVGTATLSCKAANAAGTAATGTTTVSVIAAPAVPVITTASPVVTGTAGLMASTPVQSGMTYAWSITGGTLTGGQASTSVTYSADVTGIVTLSCTVTNAVGTAKTGTAAVQATPTGVMDVSGTYSDSYSQTFTLFQSDSQVWGVRGGYAVQATLSGHTLTGVEKDSTGAIALNFVWTFAPDASSYSGLWNPGTATPSQGWTGTRKAGVSIQISPASALMQAGTTQAFQSFVAGSFDKSVAWTTTAGSIDANGVFTAPTGVGGNAVITVTSGADPSKTATATIMATPTGVMDVTGTYTCWYSNTMVLYQSGTTVTGNLVDSYRGWHFTFQGTINGSLLTGTTTRSSDGAVGNVSVTFAPDASSFAGSWSTWASYGSWSGTKQSVVSVQISPTSALMKTGATQAFQAQVAGSFNKAVTWTTTAGSINANGVFLAPSDNGGTYTVTATSVGDATKTASATVMATPTGVMDVTGTYTCWYSNTMVLYQNGTTVTGNLVDSYRGWHFTFQGTLNGNVLTGTTTRLSDGAVGNVSVTFAPDASSFAGSWSTWASYGSWSGTKQAGVVSIQITPTSALMKTGATQAFQYQVAGSFNKAVTWTTTAGSIDANGVFTAPTGVGGNAVITVTTGADPSKTATATIMATPTGVMDVTGTYTCLYSNTMVLYQSGTRVTGSVADSYRGWQFTFQGTINGSVLTGTTTRLSDGAVGNVSVSFAPDASSFAGSWSTWASYGSWSGTKQAGVVSIQITPTSALMKTGATQAFQASVAGAFDKTFTWKTTSGSITTTGVFTAPTGVGGNAVITVTSGADTSKTASATVMATPTGVMEVSGTYKDAWGYIFTLFQSGTSVWGTRVSGTIAATLSGNTLTGTIKDSTSNVTVFTWTFAPDGMSYNGLYAIAPATPNLVWTGTRQAGVSVQISPTSALTQTGAIQPFQSFVAGSFNKATTWTTTSGMVGADGVFTAPGGVGGNSVVTATSVADATKTASAIVMATPTGVMEVSGTYRDAWGYIFTVFQNGTSLWGTRVGASFTATLNGNLAKGSIKNLDGTVTVFTWTFAPDGMSYSGLYAIAPATPNLVWTATRQAGVISLQLSPLQSTVYPTWSEGMLAFSAGAFDKTIAWKVEETSGGTVSPSGTYTAPPAIGTFHVNATTVATPSATSVATVQVAVVGMEVLPVWTSLRPGAPTSFTAMIQGAPVDGVTWSVQEGAAGGSVDTSGRYTAPATPGTYHVVATSLYDATAKAVAEVHVGTDASAHVTITPYVAQLGQGGTRQFTATVSNVSNTAVTWTCSSGTIDQNGRYTAPSTYGNYTVTATSVEDSTATDTVSVVVSSGTGTDAVFTYDLNGNMTSDGTRTFEWDAENRLISVTKGTHRSEFGYDGFGHRVDIRELDADGNGNWATSVDTKYVWEGAEILESRNSDGSTTLQRYYAQGFMDSDGTALFYTRDHLGSTRELVDAFGAIRARYDYDPFGRVTKISGDKDSPFLYTGHLWYPASGLYLTLYREYDPNLGRWISRDSAGEEIGFDLYNYSDNNPINFYDPDGKAPRPCDQIWNDITNTWKNYEKTFNEYNPLEDALGGRNRAGRELWKPGGHYQKLVELQRRLQKLIKKYKNCLDRNKDDDDDDPPPPVPKWLDDHANNWLDADRTKSGNFPVPDWGGSLRYNFENMPRPGGIFSGSPISEGAPFVEFAF